ncbi:MAG: hypothetical protein U1E26_01595 [Coriobacteriia bacterium]|nr:hypothetical protein [Coriobacteriia bacterium]
MGKVVSVRTWLVFGVGVAISVALYAAIVAAGEGASAWLSNAPSVITGVFAVLVMVWAVLQLGLNEPVGKQWAWLAAGVASFQLGQIVWTYYEAVLAVEVPFPSLADVFYLSMYPFAAVGVLTALLSFKALFDLKPALLISGALCVLATIGLYFTVFSPILADTSMDQLAKAISMFYPLGDIWLILLPGVALAITAGKLAGGRIAWPWWCAVGGYVLVAISDVAYNVTVWNGTYQSGSIIDAGWWFGFTIVATGASLAVDIQKPKA